METQLMVAYCVKEINIYHCKLSNAKRRYWK